MPARGSTSCGPFAALAWAGSARPMVQVALLLTLGALGTLISLAYIASQLPQNRNFAGREIPTAAGIVFLPIILLTGVLAVSGRVEPDGAWIWYLVYAFVAGKGGVVGDGVGGRRGGGFGGQRRRP